MGLIPLFLTNLFLLTVADRNPDNLFSRGDLDYRNLVLDRNSASLYVGANGRIFRLWAYNINDTNGNLYAEKKITLPSPELSECRAAGYSDSDCQPSTRFLSLQDQRETLFVCSSVAQKPEIRVLDASTLKDREDPRTEIGICSPDGNVNSTALLVEWGNPKELPSIYSGIRTGMAGENHLIYRPALVEKGREVHSSLRTSYTDSKWLNEPQFVGSFDIGEHVYFFFREIALESGGQQERVQRSRVARVCKKDVGGRAVLRQVWTSFVKLRLNCSISSQYPFYFDHIQSVSRVETSDDTLFYASMSTSDTAFTSSAICVFSLRSINQLFHHETFMENTGTSWMSLPPEAIPAHRPGTCVSNSQALSDSDLNFAKNHLLISEPVSGGVPLLPLRDVVFTHVLVDPKTEQNVVFAIDGRTGRFWKISHWKEGNDWKWKELEESKLSAGTLPIKDAVILPGEFFFTASHSGVSQFTLAVCASYSSCSMCSVDPYCSWNVAKKSCHPREKSHSTSVGWISSWSGRGVAECSVAVKIQTMKVLPSDTVVLKTPTTKCKWMRNGERLVTEAISNGHDSRKFAISCPSLRVLPSTNILISSSGDLLLLDAAKKDEATFECTLEQSVPVVKYRVIVDEGECTMPKTVDAYKKCWRNHCKRRNEHDFAHKIWTEQKNKVGECHLNESSNRIN